MIGFGALRRYVGGSLARQLVVGVAAVQAVLISFFVFDLVSREAAALSEGRAQRAEGVAKMLATSGLSWMLSEDVQGLNELTRSATAFDGLRYAMFVSPSGRVLAHSDPAVAGQHVADATGRSLLSGPANLRRLATSAAAIDVATPVVSSADGRLIGWAWVSLSRRDVTAAVRAAIVKGVLYVALATAFAALISGLLARSIARGLAELAEVSARFQAGARDVRVTTSRSDEVGATGRGLNRMLDAVVASEAALRRREDALSNIQRIAKLGAWRRDGSERAVWTREAYAIFGVDPSGPAPTQDEVLAAVRPEDRERVAEILADTSRDLISFQFGVRRPDGEERVCWAERRLERDSEGQVVAVSGVCQDVTEREAAAAQLQQAQKMEAVGQLTGGLAHDFNNLLGVIVGNLDFIEGELDEQSPLREFSQTALAAALKGSELTQQLLAFSRRQPLAPKVIDLNALVSNMTALLTRTIGGEVSVRFVQSSGPLPTKADPSQIESALLNLVINARDAMPAGGALTIETGRFQVDQEYAASHPEAVPGDYAVVCVSDSGAGIPPDVLAKVFEPFFTTKPVGKGSGLGLSMIYGFAKQSGGHVRIYSEVGRGTTVRLFLPAAAEEAVSAQGQASSPAAPRSLEETVLVVEDNEEVRRIAVRQLQDLGYSVLEADNGRAALAILEDDPGVDLLFTDIVMPGGMSGIELAQAARRVRPELKVLFTTGFTEAAAGSSGGFTGSDLLISKPYRKADLAVRLRAALEAA